jgi:hypothetical protein
MSATELSDEGRATYQALRAWMEQDEDGRTVLSRIAKDPGCAVAELYRWIRSRSDQAPPSVATYVSGGEIGKLINIAQVGVIQIHQSPAAEPYERERLIVEGLLIFLEKRRLLTRTYGYQSEAPKDLKDAAEKIRDRTNQAFQVLGRDSRIAPALEQLEAAAIKFQEGTEEAMRWSSVNGGQTPSSPVRRANYLRALEAYRLDMLEATFVAADLCGLPVKDTLRRAFKESRTRLRKLDAEVPGDQPA